MKHVVDVVNGNSNNYAPGKVLVTNTDGGTAVIDPVMIVGENGEIGVIGSPADIISLTPSIDAAALATGDVVFDTEALTNAARLAGGTVRLDTVDVIDTADLGIELFLIFFNANVSLGTENSAPSINDTNVANYVGHVRIQTTDYIDLGGCKVAQLNNVGRMMKAAGGSRDLYVAGYVVGAPTYGATNALKFLFGFSQG